MSSTVSEEKTPPDIEDYPFGPDLKSGHPLHYLTFLLKYFLPADFVYDFNLKKMIESEVTEQMKRNSTNHTGANECTIMTGSTAEGLAIPEYMSRKSCTGVTTRDSDQMISVKNQYLMELPLEFAEYMQGEMFEVENFASGPSNYAYIKITEKFRKASALSGKPLSDNAEYFPNTAVKEKLQNLWKPITNKTNLFTMELQGPALTKISSNPSCRDVDHVVALSFSEWPDVAAQWMIRQRTADWPDPVTRLEIVQSGYHMVPVGRKGSLKTNQEWRYSFSVAEKILAQTINKVQRQAYVIVKLVHSHFFRSPDIVSSYFLKTLYFWILERTATAKFSENNIGKIVLYVLDELALALVQKRIHHYFIPEVNLLKDTPMEHCLDLYKKVQRVRNNLFNCILQLEGKIQFLDLKRTITIHNIFYMAIASAKKNPNNYTVFEKSVRDGLIELVESYLLLMKGSENFPDEYKLERETKWNLFSDLCSETVRDMERHADIEFPSQLHFLVYTLSKFRNRGTVIAKLIFHLCCKVKISKDTANAAVNDIIEYCLSISDQKRVDILLEVQEHCNKMMMPVKEELVDNKDLYGKFNVNSINDLMASLREIMKIHGPQKY